MSSEVILTHGFSSSVLDFLIKAADQRPLHVIVTEAAPSYRGQEMAMKLAEAKISTTVMPGTKVASSAESLCSDELFQSTRHFRICYDVSCQQSHHWYSSRFVNVLITRRRLWFNE